MALRSGHGTWGTYQEAEVGRWGEFPSKSRKEVAGPVAEWLSSRTPQQAAQCFVSSNPGR